MRHAPAPLALSVEKWRFPEFGTELDSVDICASCIIAATNAHIARVGQKIVYFLLDAILRSALNDHRLPR